MALRRRKRAAEEAPVADEQAQPPERERLTPVDVQQKVFRLAFRGYNERDVDEFLDVVTESLAALHEENKRLLEQLQDAGSGGSAGALAAARHQAEAIVRDARERADQISGGAAPAASSVPSSFLVRERAFLQRIALLVQEHAGALKDEARRAREAPSRTATSGSLTAGPADAPGVAQTEPPEAEAETLAPEDTAIADDESGTGDRAPGSSRTEAAAAGTGGALAVQGAGPRSVSIPEAGADEADEETPEEAAPTPIEPIRARDGVEPGDATAPWRPVESQTGGGDAPSDDDPLVSAWESAFLDQEEEAGQPSEARVSRPGRRPSDKGEPSLRELFWGEE
jgi:DivIVA domain-containing protein